MATNQVNGIETQDPDKPGMPFVDQTMPDGSIERRYLALTPTPVNHKMLALPGLAASGIKSVAKKDWPGLAFERIHTEIPIMDQNGKGACVPPDTLIRMADGTEKFIKDVQVMDMVVSAQGRPCRVLKTMVREHSGTIRSLYLWGNRVLRVTDEHPILTDQRYVPARSIMAGDWVALPKYVPQTASVLISTEHIRARSFNSRAKGERRMQIPGRKATTIIRNKPAEVIALTPGFGWILGLYLAEGSSDLSKINWTLGIHEKETVAARLAELVKLELGAEVSLRVRSGGAGNRLDVTLYGVWWADLFESLAGKLAVGKVPHADVMSGPKDFLEGVLEGYMAGDGCSKTKYQRVGRSVSRKLAFAIYDIAQALGKRPTIHFYDPSQTGGGAVSRQRVYNVEWGTGDGHDTRNCSYEEETCVFRRVAGIEDTPFSGWVHNLEIEGDNSYVADGVGVHNCVGFAGATAVMMARVSSGAPHIPLSPWFIYSEINGGRDAGANAGDLVRALTDIGICEATYVPGMPISPAGINSPARANAYQYRLHSSIPLTTRAGDQTISEVLTAIAEGYTVLLDVMAGAGYDTGPDGKIGYIGANTNHEQAAGEGIRFDSYGSPQVLIRNSWSQQWGQGGFGWGTVNHLLASYTLIAIRAMLVNPGDLEGIAVMPAHSPV